jgi:hypothetical protein
MPTIVFGTTSRGASGCSAQRLSQESPLRRDLNLQSVLRTVCIVQCGRHRFQIEILRFSHFASLTWDAIRKPWPAIAL